MKLLKIYPNFLKKTKYTPYRRGRGYDTNAIELILSEHLPSTFLKVAKEGV